MRLMTKKKKPESGAKRPKPTRTGVPLHVWLDPALRQAIDCLAAQTRRSLTTEVTMALESHLKAAGLWPPADSPAK